MLKALKIHFTKNLKAVSMLTLALPVLLQLCSCAPVQKPNTGMISLSRELEETNRKLEELHHRVSVVQFMADNHERMITDLGKKIDSGIIATAEPSPPPTDADTTRAPLEPAPLPVVKEPPKKTAAPPEESPEYIYTKAFAALKEKKYTKAITLFDSLVSQYPNHDLADNAIYWTGEIHYSKQDYPTAIMTFKKLLDQYPKGSKVPDALLKTGYSYYALDDKENTRKYLKKVVVDFPFSNSGSKAEEMLNRLDQE